MKLVMLLVVLSFILSCAHVGPIEQPYLLINFPVLDFFIEGESDIGAVTTTGGLQLIQEKGFPSHRYSAVGVGSLVIRDHECRVSETAVVCNGKSLDGTLGGVVLKASGQFQAVNPLTVTAR